jgi:hypothetical protein
VTSFCQNLQNGSWLGSASPHKEQEHALGQIFKLASSILLHYQSKQRRPHHIQHKHGGRNSLQGVKLELEIGLGLELIVAREKSDGV